WEVWRAMEALHAQGKTRFLGVSNISLSQLQQLWEGADVKPTFVQNRCFAALAWDRPVRLFCRERGILYQGFSLLTANARELMRPPAGELARKYGKTLAQIVFR